MSSSFDLFCSNWTGISYSQPKRSNAEHFHCQPNDIYSNCFRDGIGQYEETRFVFSYSKTNAENMSYKSGYVTVIPQNWLVFSLRRATQLVGWKSIASRLLADFQSLLIKFYLFISRNRQFALLIVVWSVQSLFVHKSAFE